MAGRWSHFQICISQIAGLCYQLKDQLPYKPSLHSLRRQLLRSSCCNALACLLPFLHLDGNVRHPLQNLVRPALHKDSAYGDDLLKMAVIIPMALLDRCDDITLTQDSVNSLSHCMASNNPVGSRHQEQAHRMLSWGRAGHWWPHLPLYPLVKRFSLGASSA